MILPAESTAAAVIMDYWATGVPTAVWITIIIIGKQRDAAGYLVTGY